MYIDKESVKEIYKSARTQAYKHDLQPEQLLAVTQIYSENKAYTSPGSEQFNREVEKAAASSCWSKQRIIKNMAKFGKSLPFITFDTDEWNYARHLNFDFLRERPSENIFFAFRYGLAQRSVSEIISSNKFIQGQPSLWLGYLKEYVNDVNKQLELEAEELQIIFQSNRITGPMDLFTKYIGHREQRTILNHPLARTMRDTWMHMKNMVQEIEFEEAGLEV